MSENKLTRKKLWELYGHNYTILPEISQVKALNDLCKLHNVDETIPVLQEDLPLIEEQINLSAFKGREKEAMENAITSFPHGPLYKVYGVYGKILGER